MVELVNLIVVDRVLMLPMKSNFRVRTESRRWDDPRVCRRFQWADEVLCTSHSLQGKKTGARKWVEEFHGCSGLEFRVQVEQG